MLSVRVIHKERGQRALIVSRHIQIRNVHIVDYRYRFYDSHSRCGGSKERKNYPNEELEISASVKECAFVQSNGNSGQKLTVYIKLHQVGRNINKYRRAYGSVKTYSVDYLKTGYLGNECGYEHTYKKQRENKFFEAEFKTFYNICRKRAENNVEYNADDKDYSRILKSYKQIFIAEYLFKIFKGDMLWQKQRRGRYHITFCFQRSEQRQQNGENNHNDHCDTYHLLEHLNNRRTFFYRIKRFHHVYPPLRLFRG